VTKHNFVKVEENTPEDVKSNDDEGGFGDGMELNSFRVSNKSRQSIDHFEGHEEAE